MHQINVLQYLRLAHLQIERQIVVKNSDAKFVGLVIGFNHHQREGANCPLTKAIALVQPQENFLAISESGNI